MIYKKDLENGILYRNMTKDDIDETIRVLSESFYHGEPITSRLAFNWSRRNWLDFTALLVPRMAEEEHTILAIDLASQKIVGGFLSEDFYNPFPSQFNECTSLSAPHISSVLNTIERLETCLLSYFNLESSLKVEKGIFLHLWMLGVLPAYRRKKIGHFLYTYSLEQAKESNYHYAFAECTGTESTAMAKKNKGDCIHELDYSKWTDGKKKPFKNLPREGHKKLSLILHNFIKDKI